MKRLVLLVPIFLITAAAAADLPQVPANPIAVKKQLLFSDDFNRAELGKAWEAVVPTFTLEDNALKGTQTKLNKPAGNGKPAVRGHQAVAGIEVPTTDSVISLRFRFAGATAMSVEFDDRNHPPSGYGHICYCRMTPKSLILVDQKEEGSIRNEINAAADKSQQKEQAEKLASCEATFPVTLEKDHWYTLDLETVGDQMRASIDGKPVAYLKSPGIAHPTKSKIELGCAGQSGFFDDIQIWNAEPAK